MRQKLFLAILLLASGGSLPTPSLAQHLPDYEDFRRIDRTRRLTGQLQTAELLEVTRIDPSLISRTVEKPNGDWKLQWGAAELLTAWPKKRALFESALRGSGTNSAVALRLACAAAKRSEFDLALTWLKYCQENDGNNTAPFLAELWVRRKKSQTPPKPPLIMPTQFRDYSDEATRARVRLLEAAGYSPYAARRLGFSPDSDLIVMTRDLCKPSIAGAAAPLLKEAAKAMQFHPLFLLTELVGQSLERSVLESRPDAATSPEIRFRVTEMDTRREDLKALLAHTEHQVVDFATEPEMVQYFDNVLSLGEEEAMKQLALAVRQQPGPGQ